MKKLGETALWNCIARPALRLPALPFYVTWLVSHHVAKPAWLLSGFPQTPFLRKQ